MQTNSVPVMVMNKTKIKQNKNESHRKKNFTIVSRSNKSTYPYSFLQYQFTKGERKIEVTAYWNATVSNRPFKPTEASMKQRLRDLIQTNTPKMAVNLLCEQKVDLRTLDRLVTLHGIGSKQPTFEEMLRKKKEKFILLLTLFWP